MDKERTKWNLLSEPSCTHNRGFLQLNPNGHCKPSLTQEARMYSPQDRVQFWYTTHLDQCRRKQGRWEEIMWDIARGWRHKNWPKQDHSKYPSNTAWSKWNPSWERVEHRTGELRVYACWGKGQMTDFTMPEIRHLLRIVGDKIFAES